MQVRAGVWDGIALGLNFANGVRFGHREAPEFGVKLIQGKVGYGSNLALGLGLVQCQIGLWVQDGGGASPGERRAQFGVSLGWVGVRVSVLGSGMVAAG